MTKSEKEAIFQKCKDLGFLETKKYFTQGYCYDLPIGLNTQLFLASHTNKLYLSHIERIRMIPIRKIESTEDLENLFNAICPKNIAYRLKIKIMEKNLDIFIETL